MRFCRLSCGFVRVCLPSPPPYSPHPSHHFAMVLRARDDPNALRACTRTGLHDALYRYNETLDGIQRGLDQYLESKRAIFPRLYFISSEELLQVRCVCPP
jgi:hypothetical protein